MARPARIEGEGCWYHITSRGNERHNIFQDHEDRTHFLDLLGQMSERFQTRLHTYVLMENHYHLMLETLQANLSRAMQWMNSGYCGWYNRRHRRCGHLLQGRYQAVVVEPDRWGLELSRYVHLNPIRVRRFELDKPTQWRNRRGTGKPLGKEIWKDRIEYLRSYPWSSYRAYIGLETVPEWLNCGEILGWMGGPSEGRSEAYRCFVEGAAREGLKQTPWEELQGQVVLGDKRFVKRLQAKLSENDRAQSRLQALRKRPDFLTVVRVVERIKGERWDQFLNRQGDWGRDLVLSLARAHCGLTLQELGRLAGNVDYSAASKAIHRFQMRLNKDPELAALVARATSELSNVPA